jgi:3-hydroxyacyl-CoA dehydrogenase / 3-hydroxy-2-methylbutyryl-CoA dehydrogenase
MDVSGHTAVVTGGASGLGEAAARRLALSGAHVVIVDRNEALGAAVASEIGGTFASADVADGPEMEALINNLDDLRVLVNCAGIGAGSMTVRRNGPHDLAAFERVVRVNLIGTFNCVRLAAWRMHTLDPLGDDGERGVIVNTASIAAFDGVEGGVAYSASKAAVAGMTLPLTRDLGRHGIRVVAIAPGPFTTPMTETIPDEYSAIMGSASPFPVRFGRPPEFAFLVAHVIENSMINGEVIRIDGGQRMQPGTLR